MCVLVYLALKCDVSVRHLNSSSLLAFVSIALVGYHAGFLFSLYLLEEKERRERRQQRRRRELQPMLAYRIKCFVSCRVYYLFHFDYLF